MMKLLAAVFLFSLMPAHAADEPKTKPNFFERMWKSTKTGTGRAWEATKKAGEKTVDAAKSPFRRGKKDEPEAKTNWRKLAMTMSLEPPLVKFGETRAIEITVSVVNKGKEPVQLDFPNSQRIDVVVKNDSGKTLSKWLDDQRLEKEPGFVLINPGEKIEYSAKISTREMTEGKPFTIEAFFPGYEKLRASRTVVPRR